MKSSQTTFRFKEKNISLESPALAGTSLFKAKKLDDECHCDLSYLKFKASRPNGYNGAYFMAIDGSGLRK